MCNPAKKTFPHCCPEFNHNPATLQPCNPVTLRTINTLFTLKKITFLALLLAPLFGAAQNTLDGKVVQMTEEEAKRQSDFVAAERERLLGHPDKAIQQYKKFLYDNPEVDTAWYGLSRAYATKEDVANAIDAIGKALEKAPTNQWYAMYQAELFGKSGRIKDAAKVYEGLTKRFPQTAEFYQQLAYLSVLAGDPQGGLKALERLEKLRGITSETAEKKHLIYVGLNENKKAAAELQKLADAYPAHSEYRHKLARFYEAIGDAAAARRTYEDILRRNPDDPEAKLGAMDKKQSGGDVAFLSGLTPLFAKSELSIDEKITTLMPYLEKLDKEQDPSLLGSLIALCETLEKTHPDDPRAWSISGDVLYLGNRPQQALEKYRKCLQLNPKVFSVWENTLTILRDAGQYDELLRVSEQAIDAFPNKPLAYLFYGIAATEKGKYDDALGQLEQAALMAGPNTALRFDLIDQIGQVLIRQKEYPAAIAKYENVLSKGGDKHPGLLEHYGDALFYKGDTAGALQFWQKAAAIRKTPALEQKIAAGRI